jgi:hypothetical protein
MNPNIVWWWNPVIHFPLSGAVTQDIDALSQELREKNKAADQIIALLAQIAHGLATPVEQCQANLPTPSEIPRLAATTTLGAVLIDNESHERRVGLTKQLLGVLRSLDKEAFERAIANVAEDKPG